MKTSSRDRRATVAQLARRCGVSAITVSRALREGGGVSDDTRSRILKAAEQAGYRPSVKMGRPRRQAQTERPCIEVIMGVKFHSVYYSVLLTAIERELTLRKHDCVIRSASGDYAEFVQLCEVLRASPHTPTLVVGYLPVEQLRTLLEVRPRALLVDHTGDPP
ncbi:MAG: LacI family DNA-binding transcriptional regulator, partial [Kiritimatiellae bacterium]|nr:LacI family DNA-binding transcriptional regulator [Kiritimatiellia bacterium]